MTHPDLRATVCDFCGYGHKPGTTCPGSYPIEGVDPVQLIVSTSDGPNKNYKRLVAKARTAARKKRSR
jgi:hypothetical protein